jgi:hypothetical protein
MRAAMPDLRALVIGDALGLRLRGSGVLLASALAHTAVLLGVFLFGSPRLLATTPPEAIVVDIVRPEEVPKPEEVADVATLELKETPLVVPKLEQYAQPQQPRQGQQATRQAQPQQAQQQPQQAQQQPQQAQQPAQQAQQQPQPQQQAQKPQGQQPQQQQQAQPAQPTMDATTPVFTSLYPWPAARPASDVQAGDYRTFEGTEKLDIDEMREFKTRLKECWKPPASAAGERRLKAAVRVALRIDGSLAGPPELVEATASPYGPALVESAMRAVNQCGPYAFLPANRYDTWRRLSLTFSPDDITIAAVTR